MEELYSQLVPLVVSSFELERNRYPIRDMDYPFEMRRTPVAVDGRRVQLRKEFDQFYRCFRCAQTYQVDTSTGLPVSGYCYFHPGHALYCHGIMPGEKRYSCCHGLESAAGCNANKYHVHRGECLLDNYTGFVETRDKSELEPNRHGLYAIDCEMCYTTLGLELVTVAVTDHRFNVVYEKTVKPKNPILDYNTKFTGLKEGDLDYVSATLADVQRDLLEMFSSKTILIGHSMDSDMKALKLFHKTFIDTVILYPHRRGFPKRNSLKALMEEHLGIRIQEGPTHSGDEDANAAFHLVLKKAGISAPR